ncbi:hypothetical protein [uncultured Chryseobacterium sp.]|nr:hypothetical protein [uncultured Chryseobacterium sp.]
MPEHKSIPITPLAGEYGLGIDIHLFSGEEGIQVGVDATYKAGRNAGII